eukprot:9669121-Lingulodinium_polyedra.AAC.1
MSGWPQPRRRPRRRTPGSRPPSPSGRARRWPLVTGHVPARRARSSRAPPEGSTSRGVSAAPGPA